MENEKMQVNFAPGVTEATLRVIELHEENELPVLEPDKVELAGTIGSVHEFLLKRISEKEQINQKRCYILVDREKMTLKLVTNETDSRNKATPTMNGIIETTCPEKYIEYNNQFKIKLK